MIRLSKPSATSIHRYIAEQSAMEFAYDAVGATASSPPSDYAVDHTRIELGQGAVAFQHACLALKQWKQFELGWLEAWPTTTPILAGKTVGVLVRVFGLWWLNAARIVYVLDESDEATTRFGFAYGTLPGHAETGEERFLVEWNHADDSVWYDILAFSRPRHFLARLGKWQVRRMQKRFARDSAAAMQRAVSAQSR